MEGDSRKMSLQEKAAEQRKKCGPNYPNSDCAMLACYEHCPICALEGFDPFAPAMEAEGDEDN